MTHTATRDFELTSGKHCFAYGEVRYSFTITPGRPAKMWAEGGCGYPHPAEGPEVDVSDIHIRLAPGKDWTPVDGWLWDLLREVPDSWLIEQLAEAEE